MDYEKALSENIKLFLKINGTAPLGVSWRTKKYKQLRKQLGTVE
jgi:hypothetical protein